MKLFVSPHVRSLIDLAIDEDDVAFDVTSNAFFAGLDVEARLVAKQDVVLAGLAMIDAVYERIDRTVRWDLEAQDGDRLPSGEVIARGYGDAASLLRGERTALNFLQRMCGVATMTARYVGALAGGSTRITDTRKTLPGWRELDKYAVACGGGANHRFSLSGGILIKDNHIAAAGGVAHAVERIRETAPHTLAVEVEVETLAQVDAALDAGADILMLDNMSTEMMVDAIQRIRKHSGDGVAIEASGNITLERLAELSDIGLDFISSGALTHSVEAVDISLQLA